MLQLMYRIAIIVGSGDTETWPNAGAPMAAGCVLVRYSGGGIVGKG